MKLRVIAFYVLLLCTTETFFINGKWTVCTKCCEDNGLYCTTTCF